MMKKSNKVRSAAGTGSSTLPEVPPLAVPSSGHGPAPTSAKQRPSSEVVERGVRRSFTGAYKLRIVRDAALAAGRGELGALLRREGLYSSHLFTWRAAAERGELAALNAKQRGPKAVTIDPRDKRIAELERDVVRLGRRAERAEAIVEVQKKLSQLLGLELPAIEEK